MDCRRASSQGRPHQNEPFKPGMESFLHGTAYTRPSWRKTYNYLRANQKIIWRHGNLPVRAMTSTASVTFSILTLDPCLIRASTHVILSALLSRQRNARSFHGPDNLRSWISFCFSHHKTIILACLSSFNESVAYDTNETGEHKQPHELNPPLGGSSVYNYFSYHPPTPWRDYFHFGPMLKI